MTARMNYYDKLPQGFQKLVEIESVLVESSLDHKIRHLVKIRASQINECAFCIDMHIKEAVIDGETHLRLHHIAGWKESNLFSAKERAALEWSEALTKLSVDSTRDEVYNRVKEYFDEQELTALTLAISVINTWNRIAISFRSVPGSLDKAYGLDKAGL